MRNFALEAYFSIWEFSAKYHMTASDAQSLSVSELLEMATTEQREQFENLWLGYTETQGGPEILQAISQTYDSLESKHIQCFAGAEEGVYIAMKTLLSAGDHCIVVVPNYQAAETIPLDFCEVSGVRLHAENHWQLDLDEVRREIKPNTRLISINFPNNPTGAILHADLYEELIEICRQHDLFLFSDEVYRMLEMDESKRIPQAADAYEKGFSLNVMSKAYGLPGLRVGWIASQDTDALKQFCQYKHFLSICNSAPSEKLATIALNARHQILSRNRSLINTNLEKLDTFFSEYSELFDWQHPDGGCVAYPAYLGKDGVEQFCQDLVKQAGVLLLPASIYRSDLMSTPENRFRIGCGRAGIDEGLDAMREFLTY